MSSVASPADFEAAARARLDERAWAYFAGGAGDEHTLHDNQRAWQALRLVPRVLQDLRGFDAGVTLLGRRWPVPLLLAPVAYQRLVHPDGERATALAASAQGCGFVLSAQSSVPLEDVAAAVRADADRGPLWFQLYRQPDAGHTRELIARAVAAGFEALVLTVDAPVHGVRDRERRAGFKLPAGVSAVNLPRAAAPAASLREHLDRHAMRWDEVERWVAESPLPVLLKGVLHPADARHAADLGAAGLVVSNHGGRTLDGTLPTADALPRIADTLGGRLPLLVDGGLRRGTDAVKALALGASAVMFGRPQVWALAAGGAAGVAQWLRLLRDEFEIALALCGCASPADVRRELLG
jgi:4-hydroxymandelate oxidase